MLPWRRTDAPTGGLLARSFGITAPFWFVAGSMIVLTAVAWRLFTRQALDAERQQVAVEQDTEVPA